MTQKEENQLKYFKDKNKQLKDDLAFYKGQLKNSRCCNCRHGTKDDDLIDCKLGVKACINGSNSPKFGCTNFWSIK